MSLAVGSEDIVSAVGEDELDGETICHHVICTQPAADSKPSPIRGVAASTTETVNSMSLVCLLADFTLVKVTRRFVHVPYSLHTPT